MKTKPRNYPGNFCFRERKRIFEIAAASLFAGKATKRASPFRNK
jgi:hypothetical protein